MLELLFFGERILILATIKYRIEEILPFTSIRLFSPAHKNN